MDKKGVKPGSPLKDVKSIASKTSPNIRDKVFLHVISLIDDEKDSIYDMLVEKLIL